LMWAICLYGQNGSDCSTGTAWVGSWDGALTELDQTIIGTGYLNYDDWRMPNVKELASIIEAQCSSPSLNPDVFPAASAGSAPTWTSSPDTDDAQNIWSEVAPKDRTTTQFLRLVRDADAASPPPCCSVTI